MRNNAEERKSRLHHGGSLESRIVTGPSFTVIEKGTVCTPDGPLFLGFDVDSPFNTLWKEVRVTDSSSFNYATSASELAAVMQVAVKTSEKHFCRCQKFSVRCGAGKAAVHATK